MDAGKINEKTTKFEKKGKSNWSRNFLIFYLVNKSKKAFEGSGGKDKIKNVINKYHWYLCHRVNNIIDFVALEVMKLQNESIVSKINSRLSTEFSISIEMQANEL